MQARRLNLGCGTDIRPAAEGWVNMDVAALPGVDVVHDLERLPWPFKDGEFDHVLASHVLEHVPHRVPGVRGDALLAVLEEVHRVLAPRGTLEAVVPVWRDARYWADPTHTRVLPLEAFTLFVAGRERPYYSAARFTLDAWAYEQPGPRGDRALALGKGRVGLLMHLWVRAPWLRPVLPKKDGQLRVLLTRT